MDFNEVPNDTAANVAKNRYTLIALAVIFIAPVLLAYLAYFGGWFKGGSKSHGELLNPPWHIDDLSWQSTNFGEWVDSPFMGKWNWLLVVDTNHCDEVCQINWFMLQQTRLGLAKNVSKVNYLLVLDQSPVALTGEWSQIPYAQMLMNNGQIAVKQTTREGFNKQPLPANSIYLVDPLGNIFMRYSLIKDKQEAPLKSKDLRADINRVLRILDVNKKDE
jgi:hypothetical protein